MKKRGLDSHLLVGAIGFLLVFQTQVTLATNKCSEIFSRIGTASPSIVAAKKTPSEAWTEYLTPEIQKSINQAVRDLSGLRLSLDIAKSKGTSSIELTALTADYKKKEQALVEYLEKYKIMTRAELFEKMKQEILVLQSQKQTERKQDDRTKDEEARRRKEQEQKIKESVVDGNRAIFHRVEPDKFKMGEVGKQIDVTITKPFDMMATLTTQVIWKKIADLANSKFGAKYKINADPSNFKGDTLPVEKVSYEDVQTWISGLNDLSQAGEPALADLIPGHKKGDVYRLPFEAEWEFVIRGRGQLNDVYHFGSQESQLGDYGWFSGNADNQTHPVAQKKPLVIGGKEFYDMETYRNGPMIGIKVNCLVEQIHRVLVHAPSAFYVAAVGAAVRSTCALGTVPATRLIIATTLWASAL